MWNEAPTKVGGAIFDMGVAKSHVARTTANAGGRHKTFHKAFLQLTNSGNNEDGQRNKHYKEKQTASFKIHFY